jgi:hypothetical protein
MNQIGKRDARFLTDEEVSVVRHAMDRQELLAPMRDDPGDVFVQFLFECGPNETLPHFHGKDDLDVDLCVCICHEADVGKSPYGRANQNLDPGPTPSGVACL